MPSECYGSSQSRAATTAAAAAAAPFEPKEDDKTKSGNELKSAHIFASGCRVIAQVKMKFIQVPAPCEPRLVISLRMPSGAPLIILELIYFPTTACNGL